MRAGGRMSLRERVERFAESREEPIESETVDPATCCHPDPFFSVNTYTERTGGKAEVEMECTACETVVYEVLAIDDLRERQART